MSSESRFSKPPGSTATAQVKREEELKMLKALCEAVEGVSDTDRDAFQDMLRRLDKWVCLTLAQRSWVQAKYDAGVASGAILPALPVKVGKPVVSMVGALPKRPPPLPKEPERPMRRETAEHRPFKAAGLDALPDAVRRDDE